MPTEAVVESRRDTMTTPHWSDVDWFFEDVFARRLRRYIAEVARTFGVGPESTMVDPATPASAYLALDGGVSGFPDHDLALLGDECRGWSAARFTPVEVLIRTQRSVPTSFLEGVTAGAKY